MTVMNQQDKNGTAPADQRIHDLLNASIDGEISAAEQDELDRLLSSSESVRMLDRELRAVADMLDDLPVLEPPPYLQGAIERQVRLPAGTSAQKKPAGLLAWLDSNRWRTGLALAAGVVLTVSIYEMDSRPVSTDDTRNMTGTIIKSDKSSQQGRMLDSIRVDAGSLNALVELRGKDNLFTVDLQLNAEGPVDVVIDFGGRGLDLETASNASKLENAVSIGDGKLRLASNGNEHFTVRLRRTSDVQTNDPIELGFYTEDRLVEKAELNISRD